MILYFYRSVAFFLLLTTSALAVSELSTREFSIANQTDISFSLLPKPFEGASFSSIDSIIQPGQTIQTTLSTADGIRSANGVLAFHLDNHYVFSLVIKDAIVSMHGCKSKPVFYHPEEYVCTLSRLPSGVNQLLIQRPGR